jgi:hypothetical protein
LPICIIRTWVVAHVSTQCGVDLAEWLVKNGFALDWPQYSKGASRQRKGDARALERGAQLQRALALSRLQKNRRIACWLFRSTIAMSALLRIADAARTSSQVRKVPPLAEVASLLMLRPPLFIKLCVAAVVIQVCSSS